jgi:hypothetical protein
MINSLSHKKSANIFSVTSAQTKFPTVHKSPKPSNKDHTPDSAFSNKSSPILSQSIPTHSALCNSPAEPESDQYGKQVPIDSLTIIKEDNIIAFKGFTHRLPKQQISKTTIFRFGLTPLEAIEESSSEGITRKELKAVTHKSQYASPRLLNDKIGLKKLKKKKKTVNKALNILRKSPYSEVLQFSPRRLPSLKNAEKTMKIVKSLSSLRLKKASNSNNFD